jgi:hypothetical protein
VSGAAPLLKRASLLGTAKENSQGILLCGRYFIADNSEFSELIVNIEWLKVLQIVMATIRADWTEVRD